MILKSIFTLLFILKNLIMTCVGIIILHFSSAEHFLSSLALCVYNCIKFGKVLVIISSDFFSLFLSLFLETLIVHIFGGFMLSYLSLIVCSFSSPVYDRSEGDENA